MVQWHKPALTYIICITMDNTKCDKALPNRSSRCSTFHSESQPGDWRAPPALRSPAGPECYCACVNSRSRGRHSYISYYIHHCTIQVTHTFQQLLKKLDFTRHPIDTRQCSTTALALIYLNIVLFLQRDLNILHFLSVFRKFCIFLYAVHNDYLLISSCTSRVNSFKV